MHLAQQEPGRVPVVIWWNILGNYQAFLKQSFIKYSFICQRMPVSLYMQTILRRLMCRLIFMIIAGAALPQSGQDSSTWRMRTGICCVRQRKHKCLCYFCHLSSTLSMHEAQIGHKISVIWTPTDFCGALLAWRVFSKTSSKCWGLSGHWLLCSVCPSWHFMCGCRASDGNAVDNCFYLYGSS